MNAQEALPRLLEDLGKVRLVCREEQLEYVPDSALDYLSDNYEVIIFYIEQIYSKTDHAARQELCKEHGELHFSAVSDDFRQLAAGVLHDARHSREDKQILKYLYRVGDDDLDVLLRVLKYAKYVAVDARDLALARSPIENHGLVRRVGNFLSITEEEWQAVPWFLSDIIFAEQRKHADSSALTLGLDLAQLSVSDRSDIDSVTLWANLLCDLLEFKVECDWAAVMQVARFEREKYVNAVVARVQRESTGLIGRFRQCLENWARGLNLRDPVDTAIRDSESLIHRYEELLSRVPRIHPRPAIYESIKRLQGSGQTVVHELRGDMVMRDKNVIEGQGVIAPHGHVHDLSFSQVWNEAGQGIQLPQLAEELKRLREAMRPRAQAPEEHATIGHLGSAETAARKGDGPRTLEYLSKAGKWAWDVAAEIGTDLAATAIGKAMGLSR